jgi:hypothetical protein
VADYEIIWAQLLPALNRIRSLFASVLVAVTLTSCVAPPKEGKDANGKEIEYVYYTPIGSNIPVRVPKASLKLTDSDAASQGKTFTDLQRDTQASAPLPPSGTGGK